MGFSRSAGVTRVEMVTTLTVLLVAGLTVMPLFNITGRRYTSLDAGNTLSAETRKAMTLLQGRLAESLRLFGHDADGAGVLARIEPSLSPAALAGSRLPSITILNSSGTAASASVGNSLLFIAPGPALELPDVADGAGRSAPFAVKTLSLHYVYLAPHAELKIGDAPVRELWEWRSILYVDHAALTAVVDITQRNNVISALVARGNLYSLDASSALVSFYQFSPAMPWILPQPAHQALRAQAGKMIDLSARKDLGYFVYSVSPNTSAPFIHAHPVPALAAAEGDFPSGFEAVMEGPREARRVRVRVVMAAQGSFKGVIAHEHTAAAVVKDAW